jgi:hypothetical protein
VARKRNGKPKGNKKRVPSRREFITLTPFQWWQIDSLEHIYAPTIPEVLRRIVLDWLEKNHDEIEKQKRAYQEYLNRSPQ